MEKTRHEEIMTYLDRWVEEEGVCRFCDRGRTCGWSRRGRTECSQYLFAREMDCFHLWIVKFDKGVIFRKGYDNPDSFPWSREEEDEFPYRKSSESEM